MSISLDDAAALSENLIRAVSEHVEIVGSRVAVSATCASPVAAEAVVARELLRRADLALYHGKADEPGRAHHYHLGLERDNRMGLEAIGLVRSALGGDRFFAGYQPIALLADPNEVGFEALMRIDTRLGKRLTANQVCVPSINRA